MEIFNIIAGACSIFSLVLSIIAIKKVITIETKISIDNSMENVKQKVKGNRNITVGRDLNG